MLVVYGLCRRVPRAPAAGWWHLNGGSSSSAVPLREQRHTALCQPYCTAMCTAGPCCTAHRYFPEPDLPPLVLSEEYVSGVQAAMPELPAARRTRYQVRRGGCCTCLAAAHVLALHWTCIPQVLMHSLV